ncbi:hypothetical protein [Ramlibacter humi]|uniref:Uncharacterized protein n=1 Tax=Ramlibacter humi TaxID=2530451 RepID=A0A4Z0C0V8_9BURK|nr:hypothetical protein [Ramlibacter humi]TFZ03875.1 hypothetical protein EZ216_09525 [Ramlibacter humi]
MVTKNDLYAYLTCEGVRRGYCTIPEFHVRLPDGRLKKIDLVWATPRRRGPVQDASNPDYWKLAAAFEIEGCNIRHHRNGMLRHVADFADVRNLRDDEPLQRFVVLYTCAHDRAWNHDRDWEEEVAARLAWETGDAFRIIDGRHIGAAIRGIPRRGAHRRTVL